MIAIVEVLRCFFSSYGGASCFQMYRKLIIISEGGATALGM